LRGGFAGWVRDREERNPRAVYEQAIDERVRQYAELKKAVAGILYMRNKLEAEIEERRAEAARLGDDVSRSIRRADDAAALALITQRQILIEDLDRAERELASVRSEATDAKNNLVRFREEIRSLEREKVQMLATLANANARRRIQEAFEGFSIETEMRALEGVREHIARSVSEGNLDRELDADGLDARIRQIRVEARGEAARRELAEIKGRLRPVLLPSQESAVVPSSR
jgi:phage shock protein A